MRKLTILLAVSVLLLFVGVPSQSFGQTRFQIKVYDVITPDTNPMPNLANRIDDFFGVFKQFTDREMPLNGQNPVDLGSLVERGSDGLPVIHVVSLSQPCSYYMADPTGDTLENAIGAKIREPRGQFNIEVSECFEFNSDVLSNGGSDVTGTATSGGVSIGAPYAAFLQAGWFGNEQSYIGFEMPELNYVPLPNMSVGNGDTFDALANDSFTTLMHEFFHAIGFEFHDRWMGGPYFPVLHGGNGDLFPSASSYGEEILSPVEARILASLPVTNSDAYGWQAVAIDTTQPVVNIAVKEYSSNILHVVFSANDPESGIVAVLITSNYTYPQTLYWKEVGSGDDLNNIEITLDLSPILQAFPTTVAEDFHLLVFNGKGGYLDTDLALP